MNIFNLHKKAFSNNTPDLLVDRFTKICMWKMCVIWCSIRNKYFAWPSCSRNVCCSENGVILQILQIILMYHHANADLFVQLCSEDRREKSASATSSQHTCCVERYLAFVWFQTFRYLAAPLLWSQSSLSLWLSFLFIFLEEQLASITYIPSCWRV